MIHCKGRGFSLSAYLNKFQVSLKFEDGQTVGLEDFSHTYDCLYKMDHMVYEMWAAGTMAMDPISDTVALLRVEYRLFSHEGQGDPNIIEMAVPVLARGPYSQRYQRQPKSAA